MNSETTSNSSLQSTSIPSSPAAESSSTATPKTRKTRRTYTLEEKLRVIEEYENCKNYKQVCDKTGVGSTCVRDWVKNKWTLRAHANDYDDCVIKVRIVDSDLDGNEEFEKELVARVQGLRNLQYDITYNFLQQEAERLAQKHGIHSQVTLSWLRRFVKRHNLELRNFKRGFTLYTQDEMKVIKDFIKSGKC